MKFEYIVNENGCLKINDCLESSFRAECVFANAEGFGGSLVYEYCCPEQGLYEVGEVSDKNCKNAYPYAMAFKRLFDRVVLKLSKLAFSGILSEVEADEFRHTGDEATPTAVHIKVLAELASQKGVPLEKLCKNIRFLKSKKSTWQIILHA